MASLMAEKTTFKWNELSNDSKWILDYNSCDIYTTYTGSFTKNGENYIWADTAGNRFENMEYDGEKFTSSVPGQVFITQADGGMTFGPSRWSAAPTASTLDRWVDPDGTHMTTFVLRMLEFDDHHHLPDHQFHQIRRAMKRAQFMVHETVEAETVAAQKVKEEEEKKAAKVKAQLEAKAAADAVAAAEMTAKAEVSKYKKRRERASRVMEAL